MADHGGAHAGGIRARGGFLRRGAWCVVVAGALRGPAIWGIFLNDGTLAINSVFDRDEGDIGYLKAPPPLPPHLLGFSLTLLAGGQLLAFTLPPAFRLVYGVCFLLSLLYSVPPFRFKAVAGVDWLINMWGFGALTPFAAWLAVLAPWYRHRTSLSAAGHQRGMYRALAAWAITDIAVLLVFAR